MSRIYAPNSHSEPTMEAVPPPKYQVQDIQSQKFISSTSTSSHHDKPIVIPQSTNLYMKSLTPFARCYPHSLSTLSNPITDSEFLTFIDRLNHVFLSLPIFQVAHVAGGALLSAQGVLPAQAVGGVLQISSVVASAGVSFIRVRKFIKSANADTFGPRGLVCRILTTKKMMAAINFKETDAKGKLKLPALETVQDLGSHHSNSPPASIKSGESGSDGHSGIVPGVEDPTLIRLQALEGYIAPLDFDVPEPPPESWLSKTSQKPMRWANSRQVGSLKKAQEKCHKKRDSKASIVSAATFNSDNTIAEIDKKIERLHSNQGSFIQGSGHENRELERLETAKREEEEKREKTVKEIYKGTDKKMEKAYKKEEKVTNRMVWIVITKANGTPVEDESLIGVDDGDDNA